MPTSHSSKNALVYMPWFSNTAWCKQVSGSLPVAGCWTWHIHPDVRVCNDFWDKATWDYHLWNVRWIQILLSRYYHSLLKALKWFLTSASRLDWLRAKKYFQYKKFTINIIIQWWVLPDVLSLCLSFQRHQIVTCHFLYSLHNHLIVRR